MLLATTIYRSAKADILSAILIPLTQNEGRRTSRACLYMAISRWLGFFFKENIATLTKHNIVCGESTLTLNIVFWKGQIFLHFR